MTLRIRLTTRRGILALAGGAAASAAAIGATLQMLSKASASWADLGPLPPGKPVPYGAAVHSDDLPKDRDYQQALTRYCKEIVPEYGLKWSSIRPAKGHYDWRPADSVIDFARMRGLRVRGHTLVWHEAMPEWAQKISSAAEAERELVSHIETVVARYRGTIHSWDVVNEPLVDRASSASQLRQSVWMRHLGERYLEIAFRTAAAVDPRCQLVLNEFGIEMATAGDRSKRQSYRDLIRRLLDKGVPIHGVGIQAHINAEKAVDREGLAAFVADVKSMGLATLITELDMIDNKLPAPTEVRDMLTAAKTYELLDTIFRVERPAALLTWGITDKRTWVPAWSSREDKLPNRPLPLDADYRLKPMWHVIDYFCRGRA